MIVRTLATMAALAAMSGLAIVHSDQAPAATQVSTRDCAGLETDFDIPGANTHVTDASVVEADPDTGTPAYCFVEGYVEPAVRFQLKLPRDTFSGRYVQYGCDGLCGILKSTSFPECGGPQSGDAAVAVTDDGHEGQLPPGIPPELEYLKIMDGTWAADNQAARNDYFYRAPHVVSLASKRIIAAYYGAPPETSYFVGCSTGGREGMLLAQRYPHDFDGIVAGAPAHALGPLMGIYMSWLVRSNIDSDGDAILTADKLPALHEAALGACDGLDGLVDGQIDDPRACRFDPVEIQCPAGVDRPTCLTAAQVRTVRLLYDGPRDPRGRRLYPGWQSRGSELAWEGSSVPTPEGFSLSPLPDNYLRYVGYPIGRPHSSVTEIEFTARELHKLTLEGFKGNAMALDLREFRRSGGKLILWHGWDDQSLPAVATADYYQRLWQRSGGLRQTAKWARLFMVPTMYHCDLFGGYALQRFDPFPALVQWVERGHAPDRIIATGADSAGNPRSRPIFPYPFRATYDGTGSINDADNFEPARPKVWPRPIDWVGSYLHHLPGPIAR